MDVNAFIFTRYEDWYPMNADRWMRLVYIAKQALIVLACVALLTALGYGVALGLQRNGIGFDMGFLWNSANFDISEGSLLTLHGFQQFTASDTNAQALFVGFLNTVKVSVVAIALSTVLGVIVGVARVSKNWLVRHLSFGVVEFVRNTPMLIQLVFWYFAVALKLPGLSEASQWLGGIILSQQGLYLPAVVGATDLSIYAIWTLLISLGLACQVILKRDGRLFKAAGAVLFLMVTFGIGFPLSVERPQLDGMNVAGGLSLSPEYAALVVGLSVYTAAFIAEIVRGAILALHKGQWEAAAALGLTRKATFTDIVIPQVFRVVLPAFGNQYISLAKSTSLGIAIGYSDLFNVYGTVANQSGRSMEGVIVVMLSYLLLSWIISGLVNFANLQILKRGGVR